MENKNIYLSWALILFGVVFLLLFPLMHFWPAGWSWNPSQYKYEQMMVGIYATLGIFLIRAARNPLENLSLIWFTVWSSIVHGTIMLVQVLYDPSESGHLLGDIPALYFAAAVLTYLTLPMPRA